MALTENRLRTLKPKDKSYKVADHVREHEAWGLGVYCVFTDAPVIADTAIEAPEVPGVKIRNMITIRLAGVPGSGIARETRFRTAASGRATWRAAAFSK